MVRGRSVAPRIRIVEYTAHMTTAPSSPASGRDTARGAWERRRRAAWIDYLRSVREADRNDYESAEGNAWELLQRRLRRNDELFAESRATV
mgnify:CR=1 FL=1